MIFNIELMSLIMSASVIETNTSQLPLGLKTNTAKSNYFDFGKSNEHAIFTG